MADRTKVTPPQLASLLEHLVSQKINYPDRHYTIAIFGKHGIGKTSIPYQVCQAGHYAGKKDKEQTGWQYSFVPLAEIQESGDLSGLPLLQETETGTITATARPDFAPDPSDQRPGMFVIDDFNRAMEHIIQAIMRLAQFGEYRGWALPPNVILVLTGNVDDTQYNISNVDAAQGDRMYQVELNFNVKSWLDWATKPFKPNHKTNNEFATTKIDDRIIGMIARVYTDNEGLTRFPWGTPRETERLSNLILGVKNEDKAIALTELANPEFATQFASYLKFRHQYPSVSEILAMKPAEIQAFMTGLSKIVQISLIFELGLYASNRIRSGSKISSNYADKFASMLSCKAVPKDVASGITAMLGDHWATIFNRVSTATIGQGIARKMAPK